MIMDVFALIAEQKIREAMARGEFANLPGAGRPLPPEELTAVPDELRMAYKVLKNAGCLPPEVELAKEIVTLRNLLDTLEEDEEKRRRLRELNFKILKLNVMRKRPFHLDALPEYEERLVAKIAG
jgi:Domain of unknown function (DUF1992)